MIPSHLPYEVGYKYTTTGKDGAVHEFVAPEPVVAWSDSGHPLIVHQGVLTSADQVEGFVGIDLSASYVGVIPGGGWRIAWRETDGTITEVPVLAWAMDSAGEMKPITCDRSGYQEFHPFGEYDSYVFAPGEEVMVP